MWGALTLLRQDGSGLRAALRELKALPEREPIMKRVFVRGIRQYLRRDFHPSHNADEDLAGRWFAARGMTLPTAA